MPIDSTVIPSPTLIPWYYCYEPWDRSWEFGNYIINTRAKYHEDDEVADELAKSLTVVWAIRHLSIKGNTPAALGDWVAPQSLVKGYWIFGGAFRLQWGLEYIAFLTTSSPLCHIYGFPLIAFDICCLGLEKLKTSVYVMLVCFTVLKDAYFIVPWHLMVSR